MSNDNPTTPKLPINETPAPKPVDPVPPNPLDDLGDTVIDDIGTFTRIKIPTVKLPGSGTSTNFD